MLFTSIHGEDKSGQVKELVLTNKTDIHDIAQTAINAGLVGQITYKRCKTENGKITVLDECIMRISQAR